MIRNLSLDSQLTSITIPERRSHPAVLVDTRDVPFNAIGTESSTPAEGRWEQDSHRYRFNEECTNRTASKVDNSPTEAAVQISDRSHLIVAAGSRLRIFVSSLHDICVRI